MKEKDIKDLFYEVLSTLQSMAWRIDTISQTLSNVKDDDGYMAYGYEHDCYKLIRDLESKIVEVFPPEQEE